MTTTPRERGAEATTEKCPTCDADLEVHTNADGSTSPERCDNCYPVDMVETAAAQDATPDRERAVIEDTNDEGNDNNE